MYTPPAFAETDQAEIQAMIETAGLASLITMTSEGLMATPLPLLLNTHEGQQGTLYGHIARANPQWKLEPQGEALVIFPGLDAYVSPGWYASKAEHGKVVPTWNYSAVHAYGAVEFFEDAGRLHQVVSDLTEKHEKNRAEPWTVTDAPEAFISAHMRGIVGVRIELSRIEAKKKLSQNRLQPDRQGVAEGLAKEASPSARAMASKIPV
ncbi:FMN-binding negative transcriptional regulator [Roseibium litorale]|uniref:FMN-binding negative transcriptional regulator n=1 Tax=Roseibium litorale TaxID=2803841 RepID=A0ABR9CIG2_9HYPH|nr:FMN-binding negative transcriptional regulator [Roseibium litorale]MBD8890617.1 FMN-binding negative transcriptional regulator [Roseibium litorale]